MKYPNILRTFHYNQDEKNIYLILECAISGTLKDLLEMHSRLTEEAAFPLFSQCCLGLQYLHSKKIVHGDFKIENLLLSDQNNVKLCDYGYYQNLMLK